MKTERKQPKPPAEMRGTGQAEAAQQNRQREARMRIVKALERMRIPREKWQPIVQSPAGPEYWQTVTPDPFHPPVFNRLHQSLTDWANKADVAWTRHRDDQIQLFQSWVTLGVDDPIPEEKRSRGPGKTRRNVTPDARYDWAALRLCGMEWKQIAIDYDVTEDRVRKAATPVLRLADWARPPADLPKRARRK